jgi:hypothetical protein
MGYTSIVITKELYLLYELLCHQYVVMPREIRVFTDNSRFPALATVKHAAYRYNPFYVASYPAHDADLVEPWLEERGCYELRSDATQQFVVIIDTEISGLNGAEGKVLAWARVKQPARLLNLAATVGMKTSTIDAIAGTPAANERTEEDAMLKHNMPPLPLPPDPDLDLQLHMRYKINPCNEKYYNRSIDYKIDSVATHPDYEGQGLGSIILSE